jgi:predicted nucleic acid-binding protein
MEEIILNSDILLHYYMLRVGEDPERHEQATAVMGLVYEGQLTAHISDIVLFEVAKFLLEVDASDLAPELYEEHREHLFQYTSIDYFIERTQRYLLPLLELPNVIIRDKEQWKQTLWNLGIGFSITLETAYNLASVELEALDKIQGVVTFEELHGATDRMNIPRIDPSSLL